MKRMSAPRVALFAVLLVTLAATASAQDPAATGSDGDSGIHDPWEGMNRGIFSFNEGVDRWFLEPVATGWDFVFPDPVETAIQRFFRNLNFPVVFLNDLLQAKPLAAAQDVGRFVVNTTVGVAGFFDPATWIGLAESDEDFGQTLGVWGVPTGPYLVLPLLGPSNPRDAGGLVADYAASGWYFLPFYASLPAGSVRIVNQRSRMLETVREERKAAFDFYAAVRNAYVQRRENQVFDREPDSKEGDDDLYDDQSLDEEP